MVAPRLSNRMRNYDCPQCGAAVPFRSSVAVFATCLGLVQALKYALFEEQLRTRRLITLKRFLSDADMWKKVLS